MGVTIAVAACATVVPVDRPSISPDLAWQERKSELEKFSSWRLSGRIAIKSPQDSWDASIYWQQTDSAFDIRFMTHLGQAVAQLQGQPGLAVLHTSDEEVTATDVGELLRKHFGWVIPVQGLRYWVLGLPDPHLVEDKALDEQGRLVWLEQSGWHIEFTRYHRIGEFEIPRKMVLEYPELRVRLIIDRWEPDIESVSGRQDQRNPRYSLKVKNDAVINN